MLSFNQNYYKNSYKNILNIDKEIRVPIDTILIERSCIKGHMM